jgi:hypothetical protein
MGGLGAGLIAKHAWYAPLWAAIQDLGWPDAFGRFEKGLAVVFHPMGMRPVTHATWTERCKRYGTPTPLHMPSSTWIC